MCSLIMGRAPSPHSCMVIASAPHHIWCAAASSGKKEMSYRNGTNTAAEWIHHYNNSNARGGLLLIERALMHTKIHLYIIGERNVRIACTLFTD